MRVNLIKLSICTEVGRFSHQWRVGKVSSADREWINCGGF